MAPGPAEHMGRRCTTTCLLMLQPTHHALCAYHTCMHAVLPCSKKAYALSAFWPLLSLRLKRYGAAGDQDLGLKGR